MRDFLQRNALTTLAVLMVSALLASRVRLVLQGLDTYRWQETSATVTYTSIDQHSDTYTPRVHYVYEIDGKKITSANVEVTRRGLHFGDPRTAQAFLERYAVGSTITAYVEPGQPNHAVLVRGASRLAWIYLWVGLAIDLFAIRALYRAWQRDLRKVAEGHPEAERDATAD